AFEPSAVDLIVTEGIDRDTLARPPPGFPRERDQADVVHARIDVHRSTTLHVVPCCQIASCVLPGTNPTPKSEAGERGLDGCEGRRTSSDSWPPDQGARRSRRQSIGGGSAVADPERVVPATPQVVATRLHAPPLGRKLPRGSPVAPLPRRYRPR